MNSTNNTKQAAWVAMGSLFSFGFSIISSMILSRFFEKADYGTYKQVMYVYNTLLTVFTLGLPRAYSYFLPRVSNNEAKSVIKKINKLFFILGGIFSSLLFFGADYIAGVLNNADLVKALKIFSPVPLLMLPTMGLEAILATYKKTHFLALYNVITRSVMLICVTMPVCFFNGGYIEALLGFTIASCVSFIVALYLKFLPVRRYQTAPTTISYKTIFDFSLPLLYASLWGMIIKSADQFFVSRYYGNEVFAEFSNGAMELPFIGMIIGTCSTILSPIFSKLSHQQVDLRSELYPIWMNVFKKCTMLIYPILLFCCFFSDVLMGLLYGAKYESSYIYFCIISLTNFFTIIVFAPFLINTGKVKLYANIHMIIAISIVLLEYISVKLHFSSYSIVAISTMCNIVKIFIMLHVISKMFGTRIIELFPIGTIVKIVIPSVAILLISRYILAQFELNYLLTILFGGVVYLSAFFVCSKVTKLDYISIIAPLFKKKGV